MKENIFNDRFTYYLCDFSEFWLNISQNQLNFKLFIKNE